MITGNTRKIGILGWPVEHSLSPVMQNAAFTELGLNYIYLPMAVKPEKIAQAVEGLKALDFVGANVTIPHKIAVMEYLDDLDQSAKMVGAANTIVIQDGKCIGYNTDAEGFIRSLIAQGTCIKDKKFVLLGAGGAARAVVWGLVEQGAGQIILGVRNQEKGQQLANIFLSHTEIVVYDWQDAQFSLQLHSCEGVINCTPLGMSPQISVMPPVDWKSLNPGAIVCDLIYIPEKTLLLQQAEQLGHPIMNGEGMLVEQGAAAFELWTGRKAPREIMYRILRQELQTRHK